MKLFHTVPGGRNWTLLGKHEIIDVDHPDEIYLTRWIPMNTPLFAIYVHKIHRPDPSSRPLHDHPWSFISITLKGSYRERWAPEGWPNKDRLLPPAVWRYRRAKDLHRIEVLFDKPVWTLILRGRRYRLWGFHAIGEPWIESKMWLDRFHRNSNAGDTEVPPFS
jgi:hypothetical protein